MPNKIEDLKTLWTLRDARIVEMYKLRRLIDDLAKKNYESVALNDPKNMVRLATYLLAALPMRHRIPSGADAAEQERNSIVERALASLWREKDQEQRLRGRKPWRWEMADMLCMTGWYAVYVDVESDGGKPQFVAELWNPARAYPSFSDSGLDAVYYEYAASQSAINQKARSLGWNMTSVPSAALKPNMTVGLLWEMRDGEAVQCVYVGGVEVSTVHTGKPTIPVFIGAVGGEGRWGGYSLSDASWARYYGESVLEANSEMFKAQNRWMSYLLQLTRQAAKSTLKHVGGQPGSVTENDLGNIIDLGINEDIAPMQTSQVPAAANFVLQVLQEKVQQGGFNWALFGSSGPLNLSGIAISQLLTSAYAIVGEHHETLQQLVADIDMVWLSKFKSGRFKPVSVVTKKPGVVGLVREDFTRDMIQDTPYVEVTFPLATPKNMIERLAAARQAQPVGPLLDQVSVLEDVLEVDDPQLVITRLSQQQSDQSPLMMQIKLISDLRTFAQTLRTRPRPDAQLADLIDAAWQRMLASLGQQGQPQQPTPGIPATAGLSPEAAGRPRSLAAQLFGQGQPNAGMENMMPPPEAPLPQGAPTGGQQ